MTVLDDLLEAMRRGAIEVVDLTAPLRADTPILQLPDPFTNTPGFSLEELSRYDDRGPAWYWNAIHTGEHVGTHFDAPVHWITGRDGLDVSQVPPTQLVAPAVVLDATDLVADDPDFVLEIDHVRSWEQEHGALPDGGWLLYRTGWDVRSAEQDAFLNADETGSHTPGLSAECARWLAEDTAIIGVGVETVGTDAGGAVAFEPPFPCHAFFLGNGKYGLIAAPLPIVEGSGSPVRVLALVER
jgi:kynurenine formamidase